MTAGRDTGMTLIETLVALAIMAMVGSLVFASIETAIQTLVVRRAFDQLESDLREARAAAIIRQDPVIFTASQNGHAFGHTGGLREDVPASIAVSVSPAGIEFYPDGSSTGGTILVSAGTLRTHLFVDPVAGSVSP